MTTDDRIRIALLNEVAARANEPGLQPASVVKAVQQKLSILDDGPDARRSTRRKQHRQQHRGRREPNSRLDFHCHSLPQGMSETCQGECASHARRLGPLTRRRDAVSRNDRLHRYPSRRHRSNEPYSHTLVAPRAGGSAYSKLGSHASASRGPRCGSRCSIRTHVFQRKMASSFPGGRIASALPYQPNAFSIHS